MRNVSEFECGTNPLKKFLERVNFMMSEVLTDAIKRTLLEYSDVMVSWQNFQCENIFMFFLFYVHSSFVCVDIHVLEQWIS